MTTNSQYFVLAVCFNAIMVSAAEAQGTFQNLDFESATVATSPPAQFPNLVSIADSLPGWTGYLGTVQQTETEYNVMTLGAANVAVLGPSWTSTQPGVIDGSYSVLLEAGAVPNAFTGNAWIEQVGTIPANANSMEFKAWENGNLSDLGVSFAGNSLSPVLLSSGLTYNLYGVNIGPYAGQTGALEFSAIFNNLGATWVNLDDISFSPNPITVTPEPDALTLMGIGGALFAVCRRFAPKRRTQI